jgi:hypothetical protein
MNGSLSSRTIMSYGLSGFCVAKMLTKRVSKLQTPETLFIPYLRPVELAQRRPSAAARDQLSSFEEKDYLRSTLSRRQLQGFVGRRG